MKGLIDTPRLPIKDIILIGLLPGFLKKFVYRRKGYKIGKDVSIGLGSVIIGKDVTIGNDTHIGFLTIIRGRYIEIGSHVSIGSMTIVDTPHFEIGDGSVMNEQVFVGGLELPESKLVLGKNTIVMQMTFINTTMPVTIGDDSGIGGHCLFFTHGSWLSKFEGYPVTFAPIEIGKSVWFPWRVFVMPGASVGDGSVIGANSMVSGKIPERALAVGSPAKVLREAPDFPPEVKDEKKVSMLKDIISEMFRYLDYIDVSSSEVDSIYEIVRMKKRLFGMSRQAWRMSVRYEDIEGIQNVPLDSGINIFVSLKRIPENIRARLNQLNIMWIDVLQKERSETSNELGEEVALFLKRYGVRLLYV